LKAAKGTEAVTVNGFRTLQAGYNKPAVQGIAGQLFLAEFYFLTTRMTDATSLYHFNMLPLFPKT
jgi:hypothetical protein